MKLDFLLKSKEFYTLIMVKNKFITYLKALSGYCINSIKDFMS